MLCILRLQNVAYIAKLVARLLQLLPELIQLRNVFLPERPAAAQLMALQKRIIVELHGILRYLPQLPLRKKRPHRNGCVFRAKSFIRNLYRQRCRFQKLIVSAVGLDESALDAAFKNTGKHQALGNRHVSRQHPNPMDFFGIRINICQR